MTVTKQQLGESKKRVDEKLKALDKMMKEFLEERGWEYTKETPTGEWMWKKVIDGALNLVDVTNALAIQSFEE